MSGGGRHGRRSGAVAFFGLENGLERNLFARLADPWGVVSQIVFLGGVGFFGFWFLWVIVGRFRARVGDLVWIGEREGEIGRK